VDFSANDLARSADRKEPSPKTAACMEILRQRLEAGPVDSERMWSDLKAAGFSVNVIKAAKKELGVQSVKQSFKAGAWWWATTEQAEKLARMPS